MPGRILTATIALAALCFTAAAPVFNPKPWLADLDQMRHAMATKYSDLEWAVFDRELDLNGLFADARSRILMAHSEADARAAFDRLVRKIGDGHVDVRWAAPQKKSASGDRCKALGYDPAMFGGPLVSLATGYRPLPAPPEFPSGLLDVNGRKVGVLKIGLFFSKGTPDLCRDALAALHIDANKPCDDACADRVEDWAEDRMTRDLAQALRSIAEYGPSVLIVDIAGNGGGSEWAEAAARMVTHIRLRSERVGFVRGKHWADELGDMAKDVRKAAAKAKGADRTLLLSLAGEAEEKRKEALGACDSAAIWRGERPACSWLGEGFYGSGMLASGDPARLGGKAWAPIVFSPAKYPYTEGIWKRGLVVLIDGSTGSAASQFAAILQDNRAATIVGSPAPGGCGHTDGGTPTTLANSKAVLSVPDCVRYRADGSNEANGIEPDVVVGFLPGEGPHRRAARLLAKLPEAILRADSLVSPE